MRKLVFLPVVTALVLADFGAFGAAARGSRGGTTNAGNNASGASAPVAARAAVRGAKPVSTAQPAQQNAPVAARAATRNTPKTTTSVATNTQTTTNGAVAARAGAKQKVINMGTKVATATANTVVSQECQDAYFGCMDSFCMLENVTGGRCKCSDKNAEYDNLLAEIMKLDQQSYVMQTEGVSLLKMGKSADEVYAMAEDAANKVSKDKKAEEQTNSKKLDLSAWDKNLFEDDEEIFADEPAVLESDLTSTTGDKLHSTAARICTQQVPKQCSASVSMLRMVYVQKIQSDCAAYENSLKQQQLESNQKLQTARQSLRDTALEKYQESNKYDLSGCVRAFNTCMQQEEVCGEGFLGCVTFAAADNLKNNKSGTVAKQATKGVISGIALAATTMDELLAKRVYCDNILEQCVTANANDAVWTAFLKSAAPAIKTAESDAESNLRMSCVKDVSECFRTACAEQLDANTEGSSYDMCLSNPDLYKSFCKPKLEPCLLATGGTYDTPQSSSLWTALLARLASMKADACTQEVKDCLLSEDRCGKDYAGCIGLSTYDIGQLCPTDKLTACRDDRNNLSGTKLENDIRDYVAKVAQGIALNIDNSMLAQCQSALKTAMLTYCGAETECPNAMVDENIFDGILKVKFCKVGDGDQASSTSNCYTDLAMIPESEDISKYQAMLMNKIDVSRLQYAVDNVDRRIAQTNNNSYFGVKNGAVQSTQVNKSKMQDNNIFVFDDKVDLDITYSNDEMKKLQTVLNNNYKTIIDAIESDPQVVACMSGRQVQGFNKNNIDSGASQRYPNLTQNVRSIIAKAVIADVPKLYLQKEAEISSGDLASMQAKQENLIKEQFDTLKAQQDAINLQVCQSFTDADGKKDITPEYDPETAICKLSFYDNYVFQGALSYHFPLVTSANWELMEVSAVRTYVHPNGFYALPKSEIKYYRQAYGEK